MRRTIRTVNLTRNRGGGNYFLPSPRLVGPTGFVRCRRGNILWPARSGQRLREAGFGWQDLSSGPEKLGIGWQNLSSGSEKLEITWQHLSSGSEELGTGRQLLSSGPEKFEIAWQLLSSAAEKLPGRSKNSPGTEEEKNRPGASWTADFSKSAAVSTKLPAPAGRKTASEAGIRGRHLTVEIMAKTM